MTQSFIAAPLAHNTASPQAHEAALHHHSLLGSLAGNEHLSEGAWFKAWPNKPRVSADVATSLAGRKLSAAQLEHVVRDGRVSALKAALFHNSLHAEAVEIVLASKNAGQLADVILDAEDGYPFDEALRCRLADAAKGHWLLQELRFMEADVVRGHLAIWPEWAPRFSVRRNNELARLAEARPDLIEDLAKSEFIDIVSAAAGSRHLRDGALQLAVIGGPEGRSLTGEDEKSYFFALLKLVNLPAATPETIELLKNLGASAKLSDIGQAARRRLDKGGRPSLTVAYEEVEDPELLKWLFRRAFPNSSFANAKYKPLEAEALGHNPNISHEQAQEIAHHVTLTGSQCGMVDPESLLKVLEERFGVTAEPPDLRERYANYPKRWAATAQDFSDQKLIVSMQHDPESVTAWFDAQDLSEAEWDCLFSIADANVDITPADLVVLAKALALS